MKKQFFILFVFTLLPLFVNAWGFYAHKKINRLAVFTLPPEMLPFYKTYIVYLTENAVNPDMRRYAVEGEAEKHFIDIDIYDEYFGGKGQAVLKMPRYWKEAVEVFGEDTLRTYGISPWNVNWMAYRLTKAFEEENVKEILRISTELGHYIADSNVPLHTTENYNGQLTGQKGIHGFWESRLPELYFDEYDLFVGQATYLENTQLAIWEGVVKAHQAVDSVLNFERILTERFDETKKYTYEERNRVTIRNYSRPFSFSYQNMLGDQVERRMRASIKMIGDFWYSCWVNAGQPDLNKLLNQEKYDPEKDLELQQEKKEWEKRSVDSRPHNMAFQEFDENELKDHQKLTKNHRYCCQNTPYLDNYRRRALEKNYTEANNLGF